MRTVTVALSRVEAQIEGLGFQPAALGIPKLYRIIGPDQRAVWDEAENDFQAAVKEGADPIMVALACERYVFIMGEVIRFAARKIQHARIEDQIREDCWMAGEES